MIWKCRLSAMVMTGLAACALVSAACDLCTAAGQPAAADNTASRDAGRAAFVKEMTAEVKLTGAQQAKVLQALEARDAELAAGMQAVSAARAACMTAARAGDRPALANAQTALKQALNAGAAVSAKHTDAILAPLTQPQRDAWETYQVSRTLILKEFKACELTAAQQQQVREIVTASVARKNAAAPAAWQRVYASLAAEIRDKVLDAGQREQVRIYPLYARVVRELDGANLTPAQDAQVRAMCSKELGAASPTNAATGPATSSFKQAHAIATTVQTTLLTAAQRDAVATTAVYVTIQHLLEPCGLTAVQLARVRAMCGQTARATAAQSLDYAARNAARAQLLETIKSTVLTDAQRALVPALGHHPVLPVSTPAYPATNSMHTPATRP